MMQIKGLVLVWILLTQINKSDLTTCEVPSVPKGELTHITCHFNEDIVQAKKAIVIQRYDQNDTYEELFNCQWIEGQHHCDVLPGYEFDGQITKEVTLKIPSASERNVGRYVCQSIPPSGNSPCFFNLSSQVLPPDKNEDETPSFPILPVLVVVAVVLVVVLLIIFFRKRLQQQIRNMRAPSRNVEGRVEDGTPFIKRRMQKSLFTAISEDSPEKVSALLDKGVDVNCSTGKMMKTPLHIAGRHGAEKVVPVLLDRGANIKAKDSYGFTPFDDAYKYRKPGREGILQALSERRDVEAIQTRKE